jgi:integrase/recombinase XerD
MKNVWLLHIKGFKAFLSIERSLSENSVEAYIHDVNKLLQYFEVSGITSDPNQVSQRELSGFLQWINELGVSARTQARIISGLKSFFKYLMIDDFIQKDPAHLLEAPKIGRKLPDILTIKEINALVAAIDLSKPGGQRNKAIIETLYGCGLRVSELVNLKISNLYMEQGFIKVTGKGNKERLVPIGNTAVKEINNWFTYRNHLKKIEKEAENIVFLTRNGRKISRIMIFMIIKDLAEKSGLKKNISPHTFRHSFASHLIDAGADLRAVQEMLGHESITTTEIYTHLDRDYLRSAIIEFHPRS